MLSPLGPMRCKRSCLVVPTCTMYWWEGEAPRPQVLGSMMHDSQLPTR